jgi:hypothetical protein
LERSNWNAPAICVVSRTPRSHHAFEERDLAFVDEQRQLAGLGEIGLRGKQAD